MTWRTAGDVVVRRPGSIARGLLAAARRDRRRQSLSVLEKAPRLMIKLTFCLVRLPHLSREAFQTYWFETHAPLVKSVKEVLRIRRYVQLHSLPADVSDALREARGGPEGFDGVAQLWWDSFEDMASGDPAAAADAGRLLLEDESKFIDLRNSPLWWGEERVIF